ncbi:hypothetical protein [Pseudoroseicyclus sp. CXY001]|uniref:hypothetical protein n=1 Tax=Pseudoroseicyclus sp. CXY001 TaxID=3242492 RepID=UPI003570C3C2
MIFRTLNYLLLSAAVTANTGVLTGGESPLNAVFGTEFGIDLATGEITGIDLDFLHGVADSAAGRAMSEYITAVAGNLLNDAGAFDDYNAHVAEGRLPQLFPEALTNAGAVPSQIPGQWPAMEEGALPPGQLSSGVLPGGASREEGAVRIRRAGALSD